MVFVLPRPTANIGKHQLRRNLARLLIATLLVVPLTMAMAGTGHAHEQDDGDRPDASNQAAAGEPSEPDDQSDPNDQGDPNDQDEADSSDQDAPDDRDSTDDRDDSDGQAAGSTLGEHEDFDEQSTMAARSSGPKSARSPKTAGASGPAGVDVSNWQGNIDWNAVAGDGIKFAYIKATGGTSYTDEKFGDNYVDSYDAGIIRGAYHFARPADSGGARQAKFFVEHGGKWSADGKTMPPMLDIEYNPSGEDCYGLSHSAMVDWIRDFSDGVKQRSGRYPVIYTTTNWWKSCTGNSGAFKDTNPLMVANWGDSPGTLPDWPYHTIWQHTSSGSVAGIPGEVDRDSFNGSASQLDAFVQ